jgi:hypothetical protein
MGLATVEAVDLIKDVIHEPARTRMIRVHAVFALRHLARVIPAKVSRKYFRYRPTLSLIAYYHVVAIMHYYTNFLPIELLKYFTIHGHGCLRAETRGPSMSRPYRPFSLR